MQKEIFTRTDLEKLKNYLDENLKDKIITFNIILKDTYLLIELEWEKDYEPVYDDKEWEHYLKFDSTGSLYPLDENEEENGWYGYGVEDYKPGEEQLILKEIKKMFLDIKTRISETVEEYEYELKEYQDDIAYWDNVDAEIDRYRDSLLDSKKLKGDKMIKESNDNFKRKISAQRLGLSNKYDQPKQKTDLELKLDRIEARKKLGLDKEREIDPNNPWGSNIKKLKEDIDKEDPEIAELQAKIQAIRDRKEKERVDKEESDRVEKENRVKNSPEVKKVIDIINSKETIDDKIKKLFNLLVPAEGNAQSSAGELIRAIMKIMYRSYNSGDVFYEGYGISTCGNAMAYIVDRLGSSIETQVEEIAERELQDEEYDDAINEIAIEILDYINNHPETIVDESNEDMYDSDTSFIEGLEPKYDDDFELPYEIMKHLEAGNIENIEWEFESWDEFRELDIDVQDNMVYFENMNKEQFNNITNNWFRWMKSWAKDLDDEYGVPGEYDDGLDESKISNNEKKLKETEQLRYTIYYGDDARDFYEGPSHNNLKTLFRKLSSYEDAYLTAYIWDNHLDEQVYEEDSLE